MSQEITGDLTVDGTTTLKNKLILKDPTPNGTNDINVENDPKYQHMKVDHGATFYNDVECYGFFGSSSDPLKGTGGGAIMIGHGFTSPTGHPQINLTDTIGGGSGASAHITVDSNGAIQDPVTVDDQGSGYYFADVDIQQPTNGAGARFAPVVSGPITSIAVISGFGGSKYSVGDSITIFAPNQGSGASAHVSSVDSNGKIAYIAMDSYGDNYIPGQTGAFVNSSTGDGAQLQVAINGKIRAINVVAGGKGYSNTDVVTITNNPHNTLYLQQSVYDGSVSPANLDLGNLTIHGNITVEGSILNLVTQLASIIDSTLDTVGGYLGLNPNATPTLAGLNVNGGLTINAPSQTGITLGNGTLYWQTSTNPHVFGDELRTHHRRSIKRRRRIR